MQKKGIHSPIYVEVFPVLDYLFFVSLSPMLHRKFVLIAVLQEVGYPTGSQTPGVETVKDWGLLKLY